MTLCAHWAHLAHAFVLLGLQLLLAAGAPWLKLSHHGNFSSMAASLFKLLEQLPVVSPRTKSGHKKPERLHLLFGNLLDVVKVLVLDKVHQVSLVFLLKRTVRTTQLCHLQSPPSVPTFSPHLQSPPSVPTFSPHLQSPAKTARTSGFSDSSTISVSQSRAVWHTICHFERLQRGSESSGQQAGGAGHNHHANPSYS